MWYCHFHTCTPLGLRNPASLKVSQHGCWWLNIPAHPCTSQGLVNWPLIAYTCIQSPALFKLSLCTLSLVKRYHSLPSRLIVFRFPGFDLFLTSCFCHACSLIHLTAAHCPCYVWHHFGWRSDFVCPITSVKMTCFYLLLSPDCVRDTFYSIFENIITITNSVNSWFYGLLITENASLIQSSFFKATQLYYWQVGSKAIYHYRVL